MIALPSSRHNGRFLSYVSVALLLISCGTAFAQGTPPAPAAEGGAQVGHGRILLVLPFDNLIDSKASSISQPASAASAISTPKANVAANLDWIREAIPEIMNSRFTSAGFLPLGREDRLYALDHLGLPETFQPSRATALRLAQTLDADAIVIGSYAVQGTTLTLRARVVDVARLKISEEFRETGEIAQMIPLVNSLAWRVTRNLDPGFSVAEETFRAAGAKQRLDAFEQYIRGITEQEVAERLRHLKKATDLSPDFTEAWLAMGKLQFDNQQYEQAAVSFAKVKKGDPAELEAGFYRGLSLMFSGNYPKAEDAFAGVARVLPLPEVVNNEGVAMSRRGHDAIALFRQASAADPTDADYHFNLAVSLHRHGDKAEASTELEQSLKLHPNDSEARSAQAAWKTGAGSTPAASAAESSANPADGIGPLERIKRTYNGAAFRQAAQMLDEVEAARLAALPRPERAVRLSKSAHDKLDHGLLLEAEREYQDALFADEGSAEAHAGLAEVRERAGDSDQARKEAHAAIDRRPNLEAYLVLARLDLAANRLPEAREEAAEAIRLDGSSRTAKDLRKAIDTRMESHNTGAESKPAAASPTPAVKPDPSVNP